ncbi:MAG: NAD(P)/FAD-dependent oxidoreductase [Patescibacteria group bacterium]|jgi:hypothetical protein
MRIAIIGGGAAGLMTAATLLETDPQSEIFLIEKNDAIGKKVLLTGGGRCNVTTGLRDVRTILGKYPRGGKFLSSAMRVFPPEDVCAWFEEHGVPLKTEADSRVFPVSNDGREIVGVFERLFENPRLHLLLKTTVERVDKTAAGFLIKFSGRTESLAADAVVLTTGGQAYRHTGSTGDGYGFAIALGHTLTPLAPSLSALTTRESWPAEVSGLAFEKATLTAQGSRTHQFTGPFLFTHRGVSGPAVFALSSLVAFENFDAQKPLELKIDLFPDLTAEKLAIEISGRNILNPTRIFQNNLVGVIPKSLVDICIRESELPGGVRAAEVSKKDVRRTADWLKAVPFHVVARMAGEEFVTAGGISTTEINPSTMESKLCPGLYFAGEILDVDAFTGGFNLQSAWATGRLAGLSIAAAK